MMMSIGERVWNWGKGIAANTMKKIQPKKIPHGSIVSKPLLHKKQEDTPSSVEDAYSEDHAGSSALYEQLVR